MKNRYLYFILMSLGIGTSCKKFIDVPAPYTVIAAEDVFKDATTATSAQNGVYVTLAKSLPFQQSKSMGTYTDELVNLDLNDFSMACYKNSLLSNFSDPIWINYYQVIAQTNEIITRLDNSPALNAQIKNQLLGESQFTRAFAYLNLIYIFGDVPLVLSTDFRINLQLARSTQADVKAQILKDLTSAESLLTQNYVSAGTSGIYRIRPNKAAVQALLARYYLYNKEYANAALKATQVINATDQYDLVNLDQAFLKAVDINQQLPNKEAIWQLDLQQRSYSYAQGYNFLPQYGSMQNYGDNGSTYLSSTFMNAFEAGDQRQQTWILQFDDAGTTYSIPKKYDRVVNTEIPVQNETVLRLAEQFLIRAEARNESGDAIGAQTDLNRIRTRAGLSVYNGGTDKASLGIAILHERQMELFCEWGHRFFDLKRSALLQTIMPAVAAQKGGSWASYKELWPIPLADIKADPKLSQNPGYSN